MCVRACVRACSVGYRARDAHKYTHTHTHMCSNRTGPMSPRTAQKTIEHFTCALEGMKSGVGTSDNIGAMYLGLAQAYDACGPAVRNAAMVLRHGRYEHIMCAYVFMCVRTYIYTYIYVYARMYVIESAYLRVQQACDACGLAAHNAAMVLRHGMYMYISFVYTCMHVCMTSKAGVLALSTSTIYVDLQHVMQAWFSSVGCIYVCTNE